MMFSEQNTHINLIIKFMWNLKFKFMYCTQVSTGVYILAPELSRFVPERKITKYLNDIYKLVVIVFLIYLKLSSKDKHLSLGGGEYITETQTLF